MTTADDVRERVSRLEGGYEHVATKADLAQQETHIESRFAQIEARITRLETNMEARFAEMEARMEARFAEMEARMEARLAQMENRLLLKFGGLVIATVGVAVAVLRLLG